MKLRRHRRISTYSKPYTMEGMKLIRHTKISTNSKDTMEGLSYMIDSLGPHVPCTDKKK